MELIYRNEVDVSRPNKREFTPTEIPNVPSNNAHQDISGSEAPALVDRPVVGKISSAEEKLPSSPNTRTWTPSDIKTASTTDGGAHKSLGVVKSQLPSSSNAASEPVTREVSSFRKL